MINQDDIRCMASKVGAYFDVTKFGRTDGVLFTPGELERFVELIAAELVKNSPAPDLLASLKIMEARFGSEFSRSQEQPKTYGCQHIGDTCAMCEGLVSAWKAVQTARTSIHNATKGETE